MLVKRMARWVITVAASAAALFGALLLTTGGAANAASNSGCTAESPAQGSSATQCYFVATGSYVDYKVSKLAAGSSADVIDLGPFTGTDCSGNSAVGSTTITADGSGSYRLSMPDDCVAIDVVGTGKITATSSTPKCGTVRRCRVRRP